ncbi:hypothetical protein NUU61_006551 [Penicillium alfredii]|uniref:Uncharacterized protein n=1 Tax=Penicillium alfredii TaxID=1506179 RepID=A0A9W9K3W0_9EURO|nr:uncharacterized protein NUU61_006551 [Penicillium alfredii]KAJ5091681.1 hypothetical protein NUU61_006551 [Penicillium alfredii]
MPRPSRIDLSDDKSDTSTDLPDIFLNDTSEDDSSSSDPDLGSGVESDDESDNNSILDNKDEQPTPEYYL